ncbi:MAG: Fic family protein, partial [Sulfurimonas sp.]|nr:Fic family protein [Sulfurimonas sp.]
MNFTPIAPTDINGNINSSLTSKADELLIQSAKLTGTHTPQIIQTVKNLLYTVNSYYSNKIESQSTHIIDIERAMQNDYSKDTKERNLQILSLAHIEVQKECENYFKNTPNSTPYSKEFILNIHKSFYSKKGMEAFLHVSHNDLEGIIVPGAIRKQSVKVGNHIAPSYDKVESLMNEFEHLYNKSLNSSNALKLIYAL